MFLHRAPYERKPVSVRFNRTEGSVTAAIIRMPKVSTTNYFDIADLIEGADLAGTLKGILRVLAKAASGTVGHCTLAAETIARRAGYNVRTVQKKLRELVQLGWIVELGSRKGGRAGTVTRRLQVPTSAHLDAPSGRRPTSVPPTSDETPNDGHPFGDGEGSDPADGDEPPAPDATSLGETPNDDQGSKGALDAPPPALDAPPRVNVDPKRANEDHPIPPIDPSSDPSERSRRARARQQADRHTVFGVVDPEHWLSSEVTGAIEPDLGRLLHEVHVHCQKADSGYAITQQDLVAIHNLWASCGTVKPRAEHLISVWDHFQTDDWAVANGQSQSWRYLCKGFQDKLRRARQRPSRRRSAPAEVPEELTRRKAPPARRARR